jgi:hypothetical protein
MTEQLSNFGSSTLLNAISDTIEGTFTLVADGGDVFPSTGDFRVRINDELILCSGRSGDIITMSDRGIENTTATTHGEGDEVYQVVTVLGLDNYITDRLEQGNEGDPGPAGDTHILFVLPGQAQPTTGSKPYPLPYDADILFASPFCGTPPTEEAIEGTLKVNNVSILSADWTIPVDEYNGAIVTPTADPYEGNLGDLITVDVTSVGVPLEGGDVTIDVRSVSTGFTSVTTTRSNFNIPIPGTYSAGDMLLCVFATLAQTAASFPDGWELLVPMVQEEEHLGSLHLYCLVKIAETVESPSQQVVFTGGTPMQSVTLAIKNPQVISAQPDDSDSMYAGTAIDTAALPAISSTLDDSLGIWAYAQRFFDGVSDTPSLPGALTLDYADATTRPTQTNVGLVVGHKLYPAAGSTSDVYSATIDNSLVARWVGRNVMLFQGSAGGTPGVDASLDVWFRERT